MIVGTRPISYLCSQNDKRKGIMRKKCNAVMLLAMGMAFGSQTYGLANEKEVLGDSSRVHDIEEVVVMALPKEAYRLRQQPLSASSFSLRDMERLSASSLRDLSLYVPSLAMPDYGSRLTSSTYVRGIGSRINSPAVGIYLDGIPLVNKNAFNFHAYELGRVDVLRGPQGTLYGQNTEGGLLRLQSIDPMEHQGTNIHFGIGSHFRRNVEVGHHGKPSSRFAYSVAVFYLGSNGFLSNPTTNKRADLSNEAGGKLRLTFLPTHRWSLSLTADYQFTRQNAFAYGLLDTETGSVADPSANLQSNYRRNMLNTGLEAKYKGRGFTLTSMTTYQFLDDDMFMDQDYLPEDFMHLKQSQLQNALTEELTLSGTAHGAWQWTFGAFGSYQWLKTVAPVYFGEALTQPIASTIQTAMYNAMVSAMAQRFMATGMSETAARSAAQRAIEAAGGVSMDVSMDVPGTFHTPNFNLGLFHESNIHLDDRLVATLGLRYDLNRAKVEYDTRATMAMTANVMGTAATYTLLSALDHKASDTFHQLLPKVGLTYSIDTHGSNVYALVSKGYRAGGYNIQMFSDILQNELTANRNNAMRGDYTVEHSEADYENIRHTISYKPETNWNYELGTHMNLFDGTVQLDMSAFWMDIRNQQLSVMAEDYGFGRMMVNAGRSRSIGIETSLKGSTVNNHLLWSVNYSLTHATFREYKDTTTLGGVRTEVSYKGKRVPYVPMHMLSSTLDYRLDLNKDLLESITFGVNLSAQGRTYWDEANTYSQPFYAVLGAHMDAVFGRTTLKLWGKNLTDTHYNTFAISSSATGERRTFAQRAWPVSFGMDVMVRL